MLSSRFTPWDVPRFIAKYAYLVARRRPILVHFEVTHRCNAHCGFCNYWQTDPAARRTEQASFADAARYFNPLMITFTGGEPLLRRDLDEVVHGVAAAVGLVYITLITHGGMLTADRAWSLWTAGVNQFNISLDYLDGRHDAARGIPGLTRRIFEVVEAMRQRGIDSVRFNTVIRDDNLDQLMPIVQRAAALGCGVNFSLYTDSKNGNRDALIKPERLRELDEAIGALLDFKRRRRGVITSSDHYLSQVPRFVRGDIRDPCRSGVRTIHIDPTGRVKQCPDFPTDFHWTAFEEYKPIACANCFYACRGEAQAPLRWSRVRDVMA